MGWEKRGSKTYYYNKRRENGRVVSEYIGNDRFTSRKLEIIEGQKQYREMQRLVKKRWRRDEEALEAAVCDAMDITKLLTEAALLASGYHTHKRQWRRRK